LDTTPPPQNRKRLITIPPQRKQQQQQFIPRQDLAFGRKTPPTKIELEAKAKTMGNPSSFPKNIIYYEDEKPLISIDRRAKEEGIEGTTLEIMEQELHQSNNFNRGNLLLFYCIHLLCETGQKMSEFHVHHNNKLPVVSPHTLSKRILKEEKNINPFHYQFEPLDKIIKSANPSSLNKPNEEIFNMSASFIDSDGILFDEFIKSRPIFEPQQVSSTVIHLQAFFHSAKNWIIGDEKFLGLVHPNAERAEFINLKDEIPLNKVTPNIRFSAIGYGYQLPPAYRVKIDRDGKKISPHQRLLEHFQDEILAKLKKDISSTCNDLMDRFDTSSELRKTTYCENPSISAYISKVSKDKSASKLKNICNELQLNMIKGVFTNNFVTLYRVKKVDAGNITIEKVIFEEPANRSLEKKLDEMICGLKSED